MTDTVALHGRAADEFAARVHGVQPDQWTRPTPCTGWDVRALVAHLVDEQLWTAPLLEGQTIEEVAPAIPSDPLGADPRRAWEESVATARRGVESADLDTTVHLSFGDVPAREYVMQLFADLLVHAWDLARATGQEERLDPALVAACAEWFDANEDAYRGAGVVGERVDVGAEADAQTRLLARFGRDAR
jgi:uncharacterized protein (TIGR03086 family)